MTGIPEIEIEFEFDLVFCFGIRLAPYAAFVLCILCYMNLIRRLGTRQKSLWTSDWLRRRAQGNAYHATSLQELTQLILQSVLPNAYVYLFTITCINFLTGY